MSKEKALKERKDEVNKTFEQESHHKEIQQLTKISEVIRSAFQVKN